MIKSIHLNVDETDVDRCLDIIYEYMDNLCGEDKFKTISDILFTVEINKLTIDEGLALLNTTHSINSKIWMARGSFALAFQEELVKRGEWDSTLFEGILDFPKFDWTRIDLAKLIAKGPMSQCSGGRASKKDE